MLCHARITPEPALIHVGLRVFGRRSSYQDLRSRTGTEVGMAKYAS